MPGCSPLQNFPLQLIMTFCYNIILKFRGRLHYMCTKLPNHKAHTTLGIWHCSLTRLLFFTESSSRWPVFSSFSGPLYKSPTNRNLSFSSLGLLCLSSKYVVWQLETYQIKKHITTTYRGEVWLNRVFSLWSEGLRFEIQCYDHTVFNNIARSYSQGQNCKENYWMLLQVKKETTIF